MPNSVPSWPICRNLNNEVKNMVVVDPSTWISLAAVAISLVPQKHK